MSTNTLVFPKHRTTPPRTGVSAVVLPPVGVVRDLDAALHCLETGCIHGDRNAIIVRQARFALKCVETLIQTLPPAHELDALRRILERCQTPWPDSVSSVLPNHRSAQVAAHGNGVSPTGVSPTGGFPTGGSPSRWAWCILSDVLAQRESPNEGFPPGDIQNFKLRRIHDGASLSGTTANGRHVDITLRQTCPEIDPPDTPPGQWRLECEAFDPDREPSLFRRCETPEFALSAHLQHHIQQRLTQCLDACRCTLHALEVPA